MITKLSFKKYDVFKVVIGLITISNILNGVLAARVCDTCDSCTSGTCCGRENNQFPHECSCSEAYCNLTPSPTILPPLTCPINFRITNPPPRDECFTIRLPTICQGVRGRLLTAYEDRELQEGDCEWCCPTEAPTITPTTLPPSPPPNTPAPVPTPTTPTEPTPPEPTSNEDDPIINGFGGQVFKFYGRSDAWYSMLSTNSFQWNQHFYEYNQCARNIEDRMFITKTALYLPKIDQKISIEITDYTDKPPGCPQDMPNCLGDGTLSMFIDGNEIIKPGLYPLKEGGRIIAHNFDWICAQKPMEHFTEVNNEDALEKLKGYTASKKLEARSGKRNSRRRRRRLSEESSHDKDHNIAIGMLIDKTKSNKRGVNELERCEEWIQKHSNKKSLFDEPGYWSIIHVETQYLNLRIEYLFVEEDHCYRRHLNAYVEKISPELFEDGQWKGIAGETRYIKYNEDGSPIMTNRYDVLGSDNDEDYEVDGPFGTTFAALNTKESPNFSKYSIETVNSYDDDVFVI